VGANLILQVNFVRLSKA